MASALHDGVAKVSAKRMPYPKRLSMSLFLKHFFQTRRGGQLSAITPSAMFVGFTTDPRRSDTGDATWH
jgi:hypothetical protein